MSFIFGTRSLVVSAALAASIGMAACGGGGSSSSANTSTSVLKLSSAVQSQHVAEYAGAFGLLSGPGVAAIYTSVVQSFVTDVSAGNAAATTTCPTSGSIATSVQGAPTAGLQTGESATITFNQCVGQIQAPAVSSSDSVTGSMTVQVQNVQGIVGSKTSSWSYTALESANNLTLSSTNGTTTLNGSVTFTMSYDATTGLTTTTATAPTVTIGRTQTSSTVNISGTITIGSLNYSRVRGTNPSTDTLTTSGSVSVTASDAVIAFDVSTPTPITISNGSVTAGTLQLSTSDTTESIVAQNTTTLGITVTSAGKTGTYTETVADFESLIGS